MSPTQRSERPKAIVPIADAVDNGFINMLIHGDPGVGKTPLIATSPRCLILEADPRGTASATGSKADKWSVREHNDLTDAYEYLRHGGTEDYDWVWLDSLSIFQDFSLRGIMEDLHAKKAHRHVWAPDKGEYGQNMQRIKLWVTDMVDLDINFGITCHTFRYEDDDGRVTLMPWIQGKNMPDTISGYFNIVAWMYAKSKEGGKIERGIRTRKVGKIYARDRYNAIPNGKMVNPTIPKVETLVSEKREQEVNSAPSRKVASTRKSTKSSGARKKVVK